MKKKLTLTKKEQKQFSDCIMELSEILFNKMDEGIEAPEVEGTNSVDNEDKIFTFSFKASRK